MTLPINADYIFEVPSVSQPCLSDDGATGNQQIVSQQGFYLLIGAVVGGTPMARNA